jgi:hypothetical protein
MPTRRSRARSSAADGEPDRRVVGRLPSEDPERFDVLVVERV